MSVIVKFFVAMQEDAQAALERGPMGSLPVVEFGNFDAEEALLDWESRLTGYSFEELIARGHPEVVGENDSGSLVLRLSEDLVMSLSVMDRLQVRELSDWWAEEKVSNGTAIDPAVAEEIVRQLVMLVQLNSKDDASVYCWIS
ncbi:hypothetical protein QQG74_07570 [Micromonospora sp. FIMYZ51]|uniref:hypothetical protein n=1 Tax=Micromonospora sp. FIMYZ51 TaxID=3051832 RepID=UPI00311EC51A